MKSEILILLQFTNFLLNLKFKIPYKSKMNCELCYMHKDVVYTQKCFPKVEFALISCYYTEIWRANQGVYEVNLPTSILTSNQWQKFLFTEVMEREYLLPVCHIL